MKKKVVITFVISIILIFIAIVVLLIIFTGPKNTPTSTAIGKLKKKRLVQKLVEDITSVNAVTGSMRIFRHCSIIMLTAYVQYAATRSKGRRYDEKTIDSAIIDCCYFVGFFRM